MTGAITEYMDVAQMVLYGFWLFFAGLIFYLRREDKREGYPLESERSEHIRVEGYPALPDAKVYHLPHGGTYEAPHDESDDRPVSAEPVAPWPGAPLDPTGDPMLAAVGPGSYAERLPEPDRTLDGRPRFAPLRAAQDFEVAPGDPDPRGMEVLGADGAPGGTVRDLWIDRSEPQVAFLELGVPADGEERRVLLPMAQAVIDRNRGLVRVDAILGSQFAHVPALEQADRLTQRDEDRIVAYYGAGHLYALPARRESLL